MSIYESVGEWKVVEKTDAYRLEVSFCTPPYDGNAFLRCIHVVNYISAEERGEYVLFEILLKHDVLQEIIKLVSSNIGVVPFIYYPNAKDADVVEVAVEKAKQILLDEGLIQSVERLPEVPLNQRDKNMQRACQRCGYLYESCVCSNNVLVEKMNMIRVHWEAPAEAVLSEEKENVTVPDVPYDEIEKLVRDNKVNKELSATEEKPVEVVVEKKSEVVSDGKPVVSGMEL